MAPTAEEYQSLVNVGLVKFFDSNRAAFKTMAKDAYAYTVRMLAPSQIPVRVDDVILVLEPALRVSPLLLSYLAGKKVIQVPSQRSTSPQVRDGSGQAPLDTNADDLEPR